MSDVEIEAIAEIEVEGLYPAGPANKLVIGEVQVGEEAKATITGNPPQQTLNLTLPKPKKGTDYYTETEIEEIIEEITTAISNQLMATFNEGESIRIDSENGRVTAELSRIQAEIERTTAESERENSEDSRNENEETRINAENIRESNEAIRIENEAAREMTLEVTKHFIKNSMKTLETEGTSIHVSDSADYPCKLEIEGKSEQKTRSGKNLLNLENLNSSTETWIVSAKKLTLTLKPNTQYTCSSNVPAPEDFSSSVETGKVLYFNDNSWGGDGGVCIGRSKTTTTDENGKLFIAVALGRTYAEELLNGTYYIQIEEGTTATEFEEYGVMPSPDYPSQIENVSGDLEIKVVGKNLFNKNDLKIGRYIDKNGVEKESAYWSSSNYINVYRNNKLSYQGISKTGDFGYNAFYDKNKNFISSFKSVLNSDIVDIPENAEYVRFCFVKASNDIETFQLELDEKQTTYEPYKEQKVTFPFAEGQKLMKDGYLGKNGVVNKRKQIVLTGNESWSKRTGKNNSFDLTLNNKAIKGICNTYKSFTSPTQIDTKDGIYLLSSSYAIVTDLRFTDVTEFKAWLAEQYTNGTPVIVEYELEEEETTPYTEEQATAKKQIDSLKTYRTVTNVSNSQNTNMKLTYKKDLQTQFQELEAMLLESGV